ncbi:MAG TPA: PEGA domain-containing protein [Thermoplasmata archaeon]|nr:PEGA domain-containing protein [Thermoplasmata archaeon]
MNEKSAVAVVVLVFATVLMGLAAVPVSPHVGSVVSRSPSVHTAAVHLAAAPAASRAVTHVTRSASPHPATTFSRTVLVESFTELWCEYCPFESQAMYALEHVYGTNTMISTELHPCVTGNYSNCYDNWPTLNGISDYRASAHVYAVSGYPSVYFDGGHPVVGGGGSTGGASVQQLESSYKSLIQNASKIPGNVSISQAVSLSTSAGGSHTVTVNATIDSGITGSYLALTYLAESIDQNYSGSGGMHDIGSVVRAAVINESVSLTSGQTTTVSGTIPVSSQWNPSHLFAITLVQQRSNLDIENANEVPVLGVSAGLSTQSVRAGLTTQLSLMAVNSTTNAPVAGASVALSLNGPGTVSPTSGTTGSNGVFEVNYTLPFSTQEEYANLTATLTPTSGTSTVETFGFVILASLAPSTPTALGLLPVNGAVQLQWTAPSSGGAGVTYNIYRATSSSGPFSELTSVGTTSVTDGGVSSGLTYWYVVNAENAAGFSANTTAVTASPLVGTATGLPSTVTWWLQLGTGTSEVFNETGDQPIALHVSPGVYDWTVGVDSYAYLAPTNPSGQVTVGTSAVPIPAVFTPNYAIFALTVTPEGAQVLLNGQPLTLANGAFTGQEMEGTYSLQVSSPGYQTNQSTVTLTPGNTSTLTVALHPIASTTTSTSSGGLSMLDIAALAGIVIAAVVAIVAAIVLSGRRGGPTNGRTGGQ